MNNSNKINYNGLYRDIFDILVNYDILGKKIYLIETKSKLDFEVFKEDLMFDEDNIFILNEKVKKLKDLYSYDLMVLDNIKKLNFFIMVPKLENNMFKYNIIVCNEANNYENKYIKNENIFEQLVFKAVDIININPIFYKNSNFINLNIEFLKHFFDLNSSIFKEVHAWGNYNFNDESKNKPISNYESKKWIFKKLCTHICKYDNIEFINWNELINSYSYAVLCVSFEDF